VNRFIEEEEEEIRREAAEESVAGIPNSDCPDSIDAENQLKDL